MAYNNAPIIYELKYGPDENMLNMTVQSIIAKTGISNELLHQYYMELPNVKNAYI